MYDEGFELPSYPSFFNMIKQIIRKLYEYYFKEEIKEKELELINLKNTITDLRTVYEVDEPDLFDAISHLDLSALLRPHCDKVYFSDRVYGLTSKEQARDFSISTKVQCKEWIKEQHDCDEFSFALMGYWNVGLKQFAFGIAWSDSHAFNIMVDYKKQIWIVEPQTNKFIKIEDAKEPYLNLRVIMI
ncbi:MAG: hypothetical protein KAU20_01180 [Nanoarchaeota archaeon]|nr:hypothetical protein [Nanoarchaeota archaeon]